MGRERGHDRWLILGFLIFALTSVLVDRLAALDVDVCAEQSLFGSLCWYGRTIDPLYLANPQWLRVISGISAWVTARVATILGCIWPPCLHSAVCGNVEPNQRPCRRPLRSMPGLRPEASPPHRPGSRYRPAVAVVFGLPGPVLAAGPTRGH